MWLSFPVLYSQGFDPSLGDTQESAAWEAPTRGPCRPEDGIFGEEIAEALQVCVVEYSERGHRRSSNCLRFNANRCQAPKPPATPSARASTASLSCSSWLRLSRWRWPAGHFFHSMPYSAISSDGDFGVHR